MSLQLGIIPTENLTTAHILLTHAAAFQEISVLSTAVTTFTSLVAGHVLRQYIDVRED